MRTLKYYRPIKFRVWDSRRRRWVHGPGNEVNLLGETILLGGFLDGISIRYLNYIKVAQFTGLFDKNKKEIYEGDIFIFKRLAERPPRFIENPTYVQFQEGMFGFVLYGFNDMFVSLESDTRFNQVEIIGNIYENPKLCPACK